MPSKRKYPANISLWICLTSSLVLLGASKLSLWLSSQWHAVTFRIPLFNLLLLHLHLQVSFTVWFFGVVAGGNTNLVCTGGSPPLLVDMDNAGDFGGGGVPCILQGKRDVFDEEGCKKANNIYLTWRWSFSSYRDLPALLFPGITLLVGRSFFQHI